MTTARPVRVGEAFSLRFAAVYVLLNAIPSALFIVPYGRRFREIYIDLCFPVVRRFGDLVLGLDVVRPSHGTGSGDTSFDWAYLVLALALAVLAAAVWSRLRPPASFRGHELWLRTVLRYALAGNMFAYGLVKLSWYQFPPPGPEQLMLRYGDSTPMTLLWTFMGAAPAYSWFTGLIEIISGALLVFRRTTTLGALIAFAALSNIVVLNLAYDVPVKLFSSHLWAASVFLVWPDRHRLLALLVFNRPAAPAVLESPSALDRLGRVRPWLKGAVVGLLVAPTIWLQAGQLRRSAQPPPALAGVYEVRESTGEAGEMLLAVTFDNDVMTLWTARGHRESYRFTAADGLLALSRDGTEEKSTLSYASPSPEALRIEGELGGRQVRWHLAERAAFPLVSHGFHWVVELPHRN